MLSIHDVPSVLAVVSTTPPAGFENAERWLPYIGKALELYQIVSTFRLLEAEQSRTSFRACYSVELFASSPPLHDLSLVVSISTAFGCLYGNQIPGNLRRKPLSTPNMHSNLLASFQ